jgi:hypothetical protein
MEQKRRTREENDALKKSAHEALGKVVGWLEKHTIDALEKHERACLVIESLRENPVGYAYAHMAAARGFLDAGRVFTVFNTQPGTQMAVKHLMTVKKVTGKEIVWFNPASIRYLLDSLTEDEVKSLAKRAKSFSDLLSEEVGPVDYLRRFSKPRDKKPAGTAKLLATDELELEEANELNEELETTDELEAATDTDELEAATDTDELDLEEKSVVVEPMATAKKKSAPKADAQPADPKVSYVAKLRTVSGKGRAVAKQIADKIEKGGKDLVWGERMAAKMKLFA